MTNLQKYFGSAEQIAPILEEYLPTIETFCPYCKHWEDGICVVNPNWDCQNALINWLNSATKEE